MTVFFSRRKIETISGKESIIWPGKNCLGSRAGFCLINETMVIFIKYFLFISMCGRSGKSVRSGTCVIGSSELPCGC